MSRTPFILFWLVTVSALATGCRDEKQFPSRPITLVCPWSAGGGTDRVSREVGALLEDELSIPVNVINATGGSGVTGHTRGALAKPDGYTMTMITVELNMLHWRGLTNITYRDFDPLILVNRDAAALFVRRDAPWQSIAELAREIGNRPRQLKASGTAQGGIWHVAVAGWLDFIGMQVDDVIWVSINGAGPSLQELLSGGIDFICCSLPEAETLMAAGRIRPLGVMAPERVKAYPNVATFREQGVDWSMGGWRGLALPKGVPAGRKQILLDALNRVLAREEYRDFMKTNGFEARGDGPEAFSAALARHDQEFRDILNSDAYQSVRRSKYGPMVFPKIIGGMMLGVLALILLAQQRGLAGNGTDSSAIVPATDDERSRAAASTISGSLTVFWPVCLTVAWVIGFVTLMDWLGFVLTSIVFLTLFMRYLGTRLLVAGAVSSIVTVATYQLFAIQFRVPLPWGLLGW
jgi:tripartite-type tricarboxylate transporter receptor subunit TctC